MTAIGRAWPDRHRVTRGVAWLVAPIAVLLGMLLVVAGCATPNLAGSKASLKPVDRIHAQADEALARWADAVRRSGGASITFTGDLTSTIGDWTDDDSDLEAALRAGRLEAVTELSPDPPGRNEVRWLDGATQGVGVLSAAAALRDLVATADGDCQGCPALRVTDANLATGLVETTAGPAEAPIWVFTIADTSVRVTRVAVDDSVSVEPPPWNAEDPPVGISIDAATGSADSRELEVSFTGAVEDGDEPCGADYSAEAVESVLAVVVIVTEERHPDDGPCDLVGRTRTATVRLEAPLGNRAVLEVQQGLPVPVAAP